MDEGHEQNQMSVGVDILGPNRRVATVYTFADESGTLVFSTPDRIDAFLYVGSKSEH